MPGHDIRLLALDGGGVRGLSSLMILQNLMSTIDPDAPPKPCDYFDMIAGTSTGGLIAIMLGRLQMTVDECIAAYTSLSNKVFEKKSHRVKINGQLQGRFDSAALEQAVKQTLADSGHSKDALLKDRSDGACKVLVCATSKETGDTVCLTSYRSARGVAHLYDSTTIWQACRATSAATTFFDPIAIGPYQEQFVDGALGANNPIYTLWTQAQDVWGDDQLRSRLRCLVSIGAGVPALKPVRNDVLGIGATLTNLATETEKTAEQFRRDKSSLDDEGRYYRFNVSRGLEDVGLEESKKQREIAAATGRYVASQDVFRQMKACANGLARKQYFGPFRTPFSLDGVPASDKFVDRPSDTAELEKCLLPHRSHARLTGRKIFVLFGLGGVGKTQLSIDFARRHQAAFSSVFWLDGRSEDQLKRSIAGCIARIPEGQVPGTSRRWAGSHAHSQDELDDAVRSVMKWLERPDNSDWLLIFDNVDQDWIGQEARTGAYNPMRYLPGDHGSVLITTRLSRLAQLGESRRLGQVSLALGRAIIEKWFGGKLAESYAIAGSGCDDLLELLHGLPLALAQAGSYLRETGVDAATYVRIYNEQWAELMGPCDASSRPLVDYNQGSVRTTWTISFKEIERRSTNAAKLLRLWAFLDNKQLWHGLLAVTADGGGLQDRWPDWLSEMGSNVVRFLDAVGVLLRPPMGVVPGRAVAGERMGKAGARGGGAVRADAGNEGVLGGAAETDSTRRNGAEMDTKGSEQVGKFQEAEAMYKLALEGSEKALGRDHTSTLDTVNNLGILYADQGKLSEAKAMYKRALEGREKALGRDHISTLTMVNNLGVLYADQGKLPKAEAIYKQALEGCEKALGRDHILTLDIVNNLGVLYADQGKLPEAKAIYKRALEGSEKAVGWDYTSTLYTVYNLGVLYTDQGKLPEAEAIYKQALEGSEKALGRDHISTLTTVNNLGVLYAGQGKLPEAKAMYKRALEGREKALGRDHTSTLDTVYNLGVLYADQGKLPEAEAMYKRALEGREKALRRDHTSTLNTVYNLGVLYADQGKLPEAEAMYKRALEGSEKALGRDHTSTLDIVYNLGVLYADQGKLPEAKAMYKRALEGREKALGRDHISTLDTVYNLGVLYADQGKLPEAEAMYKQALEGSEKALGRDHTLTLDTVYNLGVLYADQGKLPEAEAMYKRALEGSEKARRRDHISTLYTVYNLGVLYTDQGILYADQGKLLEAKAMYKRALEGCEKALGRDHTSTLHTVYNLGVLYADQGKLPEAEAMYKRALEGYEKALGLTHPKTYTVTRNLQHLYSSRVNAPTRPGKNDPVSRTEVPGRLSTKLRNIIPFRKRSQQ
ncbi:Fc.00g081580.m01.CDS01 [Cosmosporella sp. VM-42]